MASSLIQLAAYGEATVTNPTLSQFSTKFVKHTNFAIESYKVSANGDEGDNVDFGTIQTFEIPRIGDMITNTVLEFDSPEIEVDTNRATPVKETVTEHTASGLTFDTTGQFSTPEEISGLGINNAGSDSNQKPGRISKLYFTDGSTLTDQLKTLAREQLPEFQGILVLESTSDPTSNINFNMVNINVIDNIVPNVIEVTGVVDFLANVQQINTNTTWDYQNYSIYKFTGYTPQYGYVNNSGHAAIEYVDFKIGSQVIQRFSGEYLYTKSRSRVTAGDVALTDKLAGVTSDFPLINYTGLATTSTKLGNLVDLFSPPFFVSKEWELDHSTNNVQTQLLRSNVYLPYGYAHAAQELTDNGDYPRKMTINLPFWFTEQVNKSIPLCAIYRQDMTVSVKLRHFHSLIYNVYGKIDTTDPRINNHVVKNLKLKMSYAFLDKEEIEYIRNRPVNMIVSQLQLNTFDVPKLNNTSKSYSDMVFEDFRNNYNTVWDSYFKRQGFRLNFDNSVSKLTYLIQNNEYARTPHDDNPTGWYGNQWFNYMPETESYRFKFRNNNAQVQYNKNKVSSNVNYDVTWQGVGPTGPTQKPDNLTPVNVPGFPSTMNSGTMSWFSPTTDTTCPFFSQNINPGLGANRRDQATVYTLADKWGNQNLDWWSNVHQYDWFQVTETEKWSNVTYPAADPPNTDTPFINMETSYENYQVSSANHHYLFNRDVNYRNPGLQWYFDADGNMLNAVGMSSKQIEVTAGNHLNKSVMLKNITNWPFMQQLRNMEILFDGDTVLPKEVADPLFLTCTQALSHDNTLPYTLVDINNTVPGPFQLMSNVATTGDGRTGFQFGGNPLYETDGFTTSNPPGRNSLRNALNIKNQDAEKIPFLENIYTYNFQLQSSSWNKYPTGQVNMSRVKDIELNIEFAPCKSDRTLRVYAESYNVLQVRNGLAGLLFTCGNLVG